MLTRLYIDNFRCFEKFEWKPGRKVLILGRNGTGKTSLMEAVGAILKTGARGERIDRQFKLSYRTRWMKQREQTFEVEARIRGKDFVYRLVIEPGERPARTRVGREIVQCDGEMLLDFEDGELALYPGDGGPGFAHDLDQSRSALPTVEGSPKYRRIIEFRDWLTKLSCWHIDPFAAEARAENEEREAAVDLTNLAGWYRHLVQTSPRENASFVEDLRQSIPGFDQLRLDSVGENVRILYADFLRNGKNFGVRYDELSDGQRSLICLYAIVNFAVAKGGTVVIDEPDNFISLREIEPWLMKIEDVADDHDGQVILISHHPEILNQWANPYGVEFVREGAGPVHVKKFQGDPEGTLTAAEVVAEGRDFD